MKKHEFTKYNLDIRKHLNCDRSTLIFEQLERYFIFNINGIYKFIEPCFHKLYKKGDSWVELLSCHRTSFWRAFCKIGKKHNSRWEFENSADKFEGKLYASYYDRYSNRVYFVRNHEIVTTFLSNIKNIVENKKPNPTLPISGLFKKSSKNIENVNQIKKKNNKSCSLGTEHIAQSYTESEITPSKLSKDNSHARNQDLQKQMIKIWENITKILIYAKNNRLLAFLRQAFKNRFNSCLEKWKQFCQKIADSNYLIQGSKSGWKVTLDWALLFRNLDKILSGKYDNKIDIVVCQNLPQEIKIPAETEVSQEIENLDEENEAKVFRQTLLKLLGVAKYKAIVEGCHLQTSQDKGITILASNSWKAKWLEQNYKTLLGDVVQTSDLFNKFVITVAGDQSQKSYLTITKINATFSENLEKKEVVETFLLSEITSEARCDDSNLSTDVLIKMEESQTTDSVTYDGLTEKNIIKSELSDNHQLSLQNESIENDYHRVSSNTAKLRHVLAQLTFLNLPSWLFELELNCIKGDGTAIVSLKDETCVEFARMKYSNILLKKLQQLWPAVKGIHIQQKVLEAKVGIERQMEPYTANTVGNQYQQNLDFNNRNSSSIKALGEMLSNLTHKLAGAA